MQNQLQTYKKVQHICKQIISNLLPEIVAGKSETELKHSCETLIQSHNIHEFWYHNIPVMIAIGEHTMQSISGKNYIASNQLIHRNDFLTVDLSLAINNHWGIYAQSIVVEDGFVAMNNFRNTELQDLKNIADALHQYLIEIIHPEMTFHDLYHEITAKINLYNVMNLDFRNNFGHSIEKNLSNRIYIENSQQLKLGAKKIFSFEPHIKFKNGKYGFKKADIYYFESNNVRSLIE